MLINFFKASTKFLSYIAFNSSRWRGVSEILDEESWIRGWTIVKLVEKGCSLVVAKIVEVWATCGCSSSTIADWGSFWTWSFWIRPASRSSYVNQHFGPSVVDQRALGFMVLEQCWMDYLIECVSYETLKQWMVVQDIGFLVVFGVHSFISL